MKLSLSHLTFICLLGIALSLSSCNTDNPAEQLEASTAAQLEENAPVTTGEVINRTVYMVQQANPDYDWYGASGNLPEIIPGEVAFDMIQWSSMVLDPAIPDYLYGLLHQPGAKAVLITDVPATDGSGQMQNHIYIDFRDSPGAKPYELEGAPGISLTDVATPNAGCTKRIIRIGIDGPAKDLCGCMPSYACYDDCPPTCSAINNIREIVLEKLGPHPLLDIEMPYAEVEPGVDLTTLYP